MMNELKIEDSKPLAALKNNMWQAINLLRGIVDANEFHFVLFLLTLQRKGVLQNMGFNTSGDLRQELEHAIHQSDEDTVEDLSVILRLYDRTLRSVNTKVGYELISFFRSLDQEVLEKHFSEIFDELLYKSSKWQGRFVEEFILPMELSRFARALVDLPLNAKVYNPFAGVASFSVSLDVNQQYIGQEINHTIWAIGKMRLMAYNRDYSSKLLLGDSIRDWNPIRMFKSEKPEDILIYPSEKEKYDLIIANPPYGMRLPLQINGKYGPIRSCEHFLIENGIEDLNPAGKLLAIISQAFLFHAGTERNIRQHLVENDLLEMVIALPGGLLTNTSIPVSVLVINKDKINKGFVRFIDAKSFIEIVSPREKILKDYALNSFIKSGKESEFSKLVSNEAIREFDFNLSVPRYFQKKYDGIALGELGSLIRGQRLNEDQKGKFIRIRDLKDDALDFRLNLDNIQDSDLPRQSIKLSEACLLVASRWKTLKPTYFIYSGTPIYITSDTLAFKVDESKCDIAFLIGELHSPYVIEQVEILSVGAVQPMIRREDLLTVVISLPDLAGQSNLEEQKKLIKKRLMELANEKKRELVLFNKIHGLESEIIEQNTYLRHTLAGPSSNLKGAMFNIRKILEEQIFSSKPELANLKVSDNYELTFGQYIAIIERDINKITAAVSEQLKVVLGIESKEIVPIEFVSFMRNFISEYKDRKDLSFEIVLDYDKKELIDENGNFREIFINANTDLLSDLLNNLIENAKQHAFADYDGICNISLVLLLDYGSDSKNEVILVVSNSGYPFPANFVQEDFIRKGSKGNISNGDGYGGWYINKIVKRFNGSFLIVNDDKDNPKPFDHSVTYIEFYFPIIEMT